MTKVFIEWVSVGSLAAAATAVGAPRFSLLYVTLTAAVALAVLATVRLGFRNTGRSTRSWRSGMLVEGSIAAEGQLREAARVAREVRHDASRRGDPAGAEPSARVATPIAHAAVPAIVAAPRAPAAARAQGPELAIQRIRSSMDEVSYTPGAPNVLAMTKFRDTGAAPAAADRAAPRAAQAEVAPATWAWMQEGERTVVRIRGDLDAVGAPRLKEALEALVALRPGAVVIDLSGLRMIDSAGIGAIVGGYKRFTAQGAAVRVDGLRDQPLAVFKLLRLDRLFPLQ